jgi:XRE family aerobic/anaerobic benzoate catabolism transcriptional regulator
MPADAPEAALRERRTRHDGEAAAYLRAVGERLRQVRTQRGMTQRALARQSGVSERHIAQLEAGAGNISILLLRRLARALGTEIGRLAEEQAARPPEWAMLEQALAHLPAATLTEARSLLLERYAAAPALPREARIALVGLRGAGKSALGRRLAEHRGVRFVELDREIEREGRMELRELFERHGQAGFRSLEYRALSGLIAENTPMVIATGGSLVTEPRSYDLLLAYCLTIWIQAAPEEHMQRVMEQGDLRPMAHNRRAMEDLRAILASREALYGRADRRLDTSGRTPDESFSDLLALRGLAPDHPA